MGLGLMENRHGLVADACLSEANGQAERVAALHMIEPFADWPRAIALGADKGYGADDFVNELRSMRVSPHLAQNTSGRRPAIDERTTRHPGYGISLRIRRRIEEAFGWIKTVGGQRRHGSGAATASVGLHLFRRCLQSGAPAQAFRGIGMSALATRVLIGRQRMVEADI